MGLFDKLKPKVRVRKVGKVSPAHLNHFTLTGEVRKDERFEKARWTAISISASQLERCIFDDVHSRNRSHKANPAERSRLYLHRGYGMAASIAGEWAAELDPASPDMKRAQSLQR